jgi:hypothetical protein
VFSQATTNTTRKFANSFNVFVGCFVEAPAMYVQHSVQTPRDSASGLATGWFVFVSFAQIIVLSVRAGRRQHKPLMVRMEVGQYTEVLLQKFHEMQSLDVELTYRGCVDDDTDICEIELTRTRFTYFDCFPVAFRLDNTDQTGFVDLHFTYQKIEIKAINRQSEIDNSDDVARIDGMPQDCDSSPHDIAESLDNTRVIKLTKSRYKPDV